MVDMLPEQDQALAFERIKRMVLAWAPDFTGLTVEEKNQTEKAENDEYVSGDHIDWEHI